jgi:hypothetical protein
MQTGINKKWLFMPLSILIMFTLLSAGCGTTKNTTAIAPTAGISKPHSPARTGDIKTSDKVDTVSQAISATGGIVTVSKAGDPLDGFVLDVPANSYASNLTFKVSYAPITNQTFGIDITPISPMISVDNGGTFSNNLMYVRVPVKVPDGYFAMGFYYDTTTRQLEGMPLLSTDTDSITIGVRHFSDFFISMISKSLLKTDIDSGFLPGVDDWQFKNNGSYIAPTGHCEGQSLTALWYYVTQPDGPNARLYGRYDNNGDIPATPAFQDDDSLGYRFASVIQDDIQIDATNSFWLNAGGKGFQKDSNQKWQLVNIPGIGDEATWNLFAYSIQATHEPQLVVIWADNGSGHAMIVYRIDGNNLFISDPNYPGKPKTGNTERHISYANGIFKPYDSGTNANEIEKGDVTVYGNIQYYAKTTVLSWHTIADRWGELKDKTIGDDKFPNYNPIVFKNDQGAWVALSDDLKTPYDSIAINVLPQPGLTLGVQVYRDGQTLPFDAKGNFNLLPGVNKLGIEIIGLVNNQWNYIDFQYINVVYNGLRIDPPILNGVPDEPYTFTAKVGNLPDKARVDWLVDGVQKKSGADLSLIISFPNEGKHTISAKVVDNTSGMLMQAQATAVIKTLPTTATVANNLTALQKMKTVSGFFQGQYDINPGNGHLGFNIPIPYNSTGKGINIIWNGTSFSGTVTLTDLGTQTNTVSGTVSGDGKTLTSFVYTMTWKYDGSSGEQTINLELKNVPFDKDISGNASSFSSVKYGSELKPLLVNYEQHSKSYINGKLVSEQAYLLNNISWNYEPQFAIYFNK